MIHPSPPARVSPGTNEITQIKPSSAPMTAGAGNVCSSPWTSRTPQHETAEYLAGVGGFHVIMTARGRPVLRDAIAAKTAPLMATDAQSTEYVNDLRGSSIPGRYGHGRESVTFRTPNKLPASDGEPTALPTRRGRRPCPKLLENRAQSHYVRHAVRRGDALHINNGSHVTRQSKFTDAVNSPIRPQQAYQH